MTDCLIDIAEDPEREPWHQDATDKSADPELLRQQQFMSALHGTRVIAFAVPNAGKRSDWERIQRWKEGAMAGCVDVVALWPGGVAFLEWKNGTEPPTKAQVDFLNMAYRADHHCGVFRRSDSAVEWLRSKGAPI